MPDTPQLLMFIAAGWLLKWLGKAYLVWMGLRLLMVRGVGSSMPAGAEFSPESADLWRAYRQRFLAHVLNPKVALFFLAFVPQFIVPGTSDKITVFLLLGLLFAFNSLPINFGCAWLAGWAARLVSAVQRATRWLDRAAGLMFVGFGLSLAMSDNPPR